MITISWPLLLTSLVFLSLAFFLLGWDLSVARHRDLATALEQEVSDLEDRVAAFDEQMAKDPQRAWLDLGKRTALHQMEATIRSIRHTLESHS